MKTTIDIFTTILGWSIIINFGLLLWWSVLIRFSHDFIYRIHSKWIKIPVETFDAIHYASLGFYKLLIIVFIVIPYLVLKIIA